MPTLPLIFIFFNDTATTEIYTLSLHDALPISGAAARRPVRSVGRLSSRARPPVGAAREHDSRARARLAHPRLRRRDRKSTRLNSSHTVISYAVFCLKKKKKTHQHNTRAN